jgi:hypothetical protein
VDRIEGEEVDRAASVACVDVGVVCDEVLLAGDEV